MASIFMSVRSKIDLTASECPPDAASWTHTSKQVNLKSVLGYNTFSIYDIDLSLTEVTRA